MRQVAIWPIACVALWCGSVPAGGQTVATGTRAIGGMFGGAQQTAPDASPSLRLLVDFSGGYDENVDPETAAVPIQVFSAQQSGYVGNTTVNLLFRSGSNTKFVEGSGNAYYSGASAGANRVTGGAVSTRMATPLGRRFGLTAGASVAYDPTYLFDAFGPIIDDVDGGVVPGTRPTRGVTEQQWLNAQGSAGLYRNWTPRQQTTGHLQTQRRQPISGPGFEASVDTASLRHRWNARERLILTSSFVYVDNLQRDQAGNDRSVASQALDVSATWLRPTGPSRGLTVTLSSGLNRFQQETNGRSFDVDAPIAAGVIRLDLSRQWSVSLDARRDVTIMNGITPEPFTSNLMSFRTLGAAGERILIAASASYTRGGAATSAVGSFENTVGTLQLQYALSRWCAFFSNYSYYSYRFRDVVVQPGFPSRYELNSVRAGFTLGVPVF